MKENEENVLPDNWKDLWFFHNANKENMEDVCEEGLRPTYIIDPRPKVSGHFSTLEEGEEFISKYGDKVLFFNKDPRKSLRFSNPERGNELLRFPLPKELNTDKIYKDSTGFFGKVNIPPEKIEVFDPNCRTDYGDDSCWESLDSYCEEGDRNE